MIEYTVTVVTEKNVDLEEVPNYLQKRIDEFIIAMGPELGDRPGRYMKHIKYSNKVVMASNRLDDTQIMVYLKLKGGNFCPEIRICYAYIVSTPAEKESSSMKLGAVVAQTLNTETPHSETPNSVVDLKPDSIFRYTKALGIRVAKYREFLEEFSPVAGWEWRRLRALRLTISLWRLPGTLQGLLLRMRRVPKGRQCLSLRIRRLGIRCLLHLRRLPKRL
ncbi:hypothetical protein BDP27DRAFT_81096 [Rhodocollybia butyracea]|uniref:Uncharacterized protein n=1 Tax=Rhodocollybia butyracea TaxID=206335 RepID=A0A9P5PKL0_9AGAR|nr:hypothetical protein BDP27DRAFT_81096 [Rhodocollybia butyracea]